MLSLLLLLLGQVSVTSTWIQVSDSDVSQVMNSLTSRTWSFFNLIVAFVWVIVVIWFVKLVYRFITKSKE